MKLAISNLAWPAEQEKTILALMKQYGYTGLEIAPGKVIPVDPYGNINEAKKWANMMGRDRQLSIISLQSIWYGRQEMLFGDLAERNFLLKYTMKAIDFANAVGAKNLVFGCPKNRNIPKNADLNNAHSLAVDFFRQLGNYALDREVVIGMEANPAIYGTNFLNTTQDALKFIKQVDSEGVKLNFDVGTLLANNEGLDVLADNIEMISHVHISEPGLKMIEKRKLHNELAEILEKNGYNKYVSIEMVNISNAELKQCMEYVRSVFC